MASLSHGNHGTDWSDIDFAFRFNGLGTADVMENDVYRPGGDTPLLASLSHGTRPAGEGDR